MNGDTGGVNLHIGWIGKISSLAVALNGSSTVAAHGVGGEEVGIAITTGGDDHGIGGEALQLAGDQVLGDDTTGTAVDNHHIFHLVAGVELHLAGMYLCAERRVGTEQKLLSCLSLGIERTRHLCATKRAVGQHATILAGERHALCHTLVDDIVRHLCQTVNVGLTGTVVATFHGVVEKTVYRVAIILIALGGVDTTLCGDGVCAARRVLDTEIDDIEAHLTKTGGGTGTSQTGTYDDDVEFQFILRVHQALVGLVVGPFLCYWSFGNS